MERNERFQKILEDMKSSTKMVEVLPCDESAKRKLHEKYTIDPESLLGLLLENTGGIIIDHWIRFYGSGKMDFVMKNQMIPIQNIVIAEDILGGLFLYLDNGNIGYFAPDCLELEDMEISLSQFLYWCLHGDTDTFYMDYRWNDWQEELSGLDYDNGVMFYPFLWAEADSLESRKRSIVPMKEIIELEFEFVTESATKDENVLHIAEIPYETGEIQFRYSRKMSDDGNKWIREGLFTQYYKNGNIASTGLYVNGAEHGHWTDYHENGQIAAEGDYVNGKETGTWYYYDENGNLEKEEHL